MTTQNACDLMSCTKTQSTDVMIRHATYTDGWIHLDEGPGVQDLHFCSWGHLVQYAKEAHHI